jgi:hypothetical protein
MNLFDTHISVRQTGDGRFAGRIHDHWSINGTPNGGYLMAILARAMLAGGGRQGTPILTANYLARCSPGAVTVSVEPLTASTQFSRFQASLIQEGGERIRAFGTFANQNTVCTINRTETGPPEVAAIADSVPIPALPGYTLFENLEVRLDPACAGWMVDHRLTPVSEQKGWIRFRQPRPWDLYSLILAADAFPPAVLASQGMVAWVPTLELSLNLRQIPATTWLKGIFRTRFITCGLLEEDGELWDAEGNLAAISRQIAQYRPVG